MTELIPLTPARLRQHCVCPIPWPRMLWLPAGPDAAKCAGCHKQCHLQDRARWFPVQKPDHHQPDLF